MGNPQQSQNGDFFVPHWPNNDDHHPFAIQIGMPGLQSYEHWGLSAGLWWSAKVWTTPTGLIVLRIRSKVPLIPYYDDPYDPYIKNPFIWRIAFVDHSHMIVGPQRTQYGNAGQIAVIEEEWYDDWEGNINPPHLFVCWGYRLGGWNLPSTEAPISREHVGQRVQCVVLCWFASIFELPWWRGRIVYSK